ncbi:MAG: Flp pilus assembly complex ATPase component TadA, partial [Candidatus Latescibacteria bacterium]|nr:Flp pilus assembly complex ATPase component TadA [Candidatus Latescibacterota bacterium]
KNRNLDFSYTTSLNGNSVRLRADIYFDLDHLALNMRLIASEIRAFTGLDLHPNVARSLSLMHVKQGLTVVTGITGSGKSSTLDSIIDANNRTVDAHIIIIGAPIETVHESQRCIVRHREVGRDVPSFKDGAIQALRQDPDIVVIGEMRDPETIMTSLEITDSGHRVFSTLHTASAVESIDRVIGECPPVEQERVRMRLADVLTCVLSQKLVPSLDGKRALAKEVMMATSSVRAAIRNNNTSEIYQMINEGSEEGMITMEQDLLRLFKDRKISQGEAINYANNKKRMSDLLEAV